MRLLNLFLHGKDNLPPICAIHFASYNTNTGYLLKIDLGTESKARMRMKVEQLERIIRKSDLLSDEGIRLTILNKLLRVIKNISLVYLIMVKMRYQVPIVASLSLIRLLYN